MLFSSARRVGRNLLLPLWLLIIAALAPAPSVAQAQSANFGTRAKAAILLDADTGAILFQHNADELLPPASVSKLMTAAVVFRALKDDRIKLTDEFDDERARLAHGRRALAHVRHVRAGQHARRPIDELLKA